MEHGYRLGMIRLLGRVKSRAFNIVKEGTMEATGIINIEDGAYHWKKKLDFMEYPKINSLYIREGHGEEVTPSDKRDLRKARVRINQKLESL